MGSLGLHADPDGWLNAGYSVRTLMDSLDSELYDADRIGGAGLSAHWAGPVAEAFTGHWSGVHSRAEDLIAQGRRAAAAMTDFGGKLEDFVKRAADLERYWLSFGLQIGLDGMHFAQPWGFEQLSPVHQVSFHQWLTESERDVTAMWSDIRAAVDDVVTALESLIAAFEDLAALELGALGGTLGWVLGATAGGYRKDLFTLGHDAIGWETETFKAKADHELQVARALRRAWYKDGTEEMRAAGRSLVHDAKQDVRRAGEFDHYAKFGEHALIVGAVVLTAAEVYSTAKTKGWVQGIEAHTDDITALAVSVPAGWAGVAIAGVVLAGAPAVVVVGGGVLAGGIIAAGVGLGAQWYVDHHQQQVGHALTDIGSGAEVTAKAVGITR
jgi:hypothetical protein